MTIAERFSPGDLVLLRTIEEAVAGKQERHVGYTMATRLVCDTPEAVVLFHPTGNFVVKRSGKRTESPKLPRILPGDWDGGYENDVVYNGPGIVRFNVVSDGFSILRTFTEKGFEGWYVNLELPWRRSAFGFDSRDLILDVTVADDLSEWAWKDEDEFTWAQDVGLLSKDDVELAVEQAHRAISMLEKKAWPFDADWSQWAPDLSWPIPRVPEGFDKL